MKKFGLIMCGVTSVFVIQGCSTQNGSEKLSSIAFEAVEEVNEFPVSLSLNDSARVMLDCDGIVCFDIVDSMMVASTVVIDGSWSVFTLPSAQKRCEIFRRGPGPDEFLSLPISAQVNFYHHNDSVKTSVADLYRRRQFDLNLTATVDSGYAVGRWVDNPTFSDDMVLCQSLSESLNLLTTILPEKLTAARTLMPLDGDTVKSKNLDYLNQYSVGELKNVGLLIGRTLVNDSLMRVAQVFSSQHQINIFDLNGEFARTIAVDGIVDDYEEIARQATMPVVNLDSHGYRKCFAVLHAIENSAGEISDCQLRFFDWEGRPLAEVDVPVVVHSFGIDFINRTVYTLNRDDELMLAWKSDELFNKLQ